MNAVRAIVVVGLASACSPRPATSRPATADDPDAQRAACDRGDGCACYFAADANPSDRAQIARSRPLIERGCTLGCGAACGAAGLFVQRGDYGAPPDAAAAEAWYRQGCRRDDGWSCFRLGELIGDDEARAHGCELLAAACPDRTY